MTFGPENAPQVWRWVLKSWSQRLRDFVFTADRVVYSSGKLPHPCGLDFIPHFICENIGIIRSFIFPYMSKSFLRTPVLAQLNMSLWWHTTTFTCDVVMVSIVMCAANITNISSFKTVPKLLVHIHPRFIFMCCIFLSGETKWNWINQCFLNCCIFPNFECFLCQSVPYC